MNPHDDLPEVLYPSGGGGYRNPSSHQPNTYHLKQFDPCYSHQPLNPVTFDQTGTGTSRWSSMSRSRKYWSVAGVVLLILVMVGGIIGGIVGSDMARQNARGTDDAQSGGSTGGSGGDSSTPTDGPPAPTERPGAGLSRPHELSRLAVGYGGNSPSNFRLVILQDTDGDLSAVEWRGSERDSYKIKDRFGGEASQLRRPNKNSPLSIVRHGPDGDLHLFYFDEDKRFSHIVRHAAVATGGDRSWESGSLDPGDADIPDDYVASYTLRLSATVLPSDWTGLDADCIVVIYWTARTISSVAMFSSIDPQTKDSWMSRSLSLEAESIGLLPDTISSGFLVAAIQRPDPDEEEGGGMVGGVRLMWDVGSKSDDRSFAMLDCNYVDNNTLKSCRRIRSRWADKEALDIIRDAPKPLDFSSRNFEASGPPNNSTRYLMRVLDGIGRLTELLWDDGSFVGHEAFHVDPASLPNGGNGDDLKMMKLTHVASGDENVLYGVSELGGGVAEFATERSWWADGQDSEDSEWKFVGYI